MNAESITIEDILAIRPEIKAFIFDLDGTIVNSMEGIITTVLEYLFEKEQQQFSREKIEELFGTPLEKLFKHEEDHKTRGNEKIYPRLVAQALDRGGNHVKQSAADECPGRERHEWHD